MKLIAIHRLIASEDREIPHNTEFESRDYGLSDVDVAALLESGAAKQPEAAVDDEKPAAARKDKG